MRASTYDRALPILAVFSVGGMILSVVGIWLWSHAAAFVVAGIWLMVVGYMVGERLKKLDREAGTPGAGARR